MHTRETLVIHTRRRRRRHIFVDVMQFYAWTLLPELSKTNNDHHQVIFTRTTLIRIRAKEDQLLSLLSHIFRINLTRFIQIKIEIFFFEEAEAGGKKCYITLSKFSSMNIYLTSLKLCHREVNNVLFAFHNLLIYVRRGPEEREREREKKNPVTDRGRIIDLKAEGEKKTSDERLDRIVKKKNNDGQVILRLQ